MIQKIKNLKLKLNFLIDWYHFKKLTGQNNRFPLIWKNRQAQLYDKTTTTDFDHHYLYHPSWAARIIKEINPVYHIDISSTINFCSILSAFIPVHFYDYRPADINLDNLVSKSGDLMNLPLEDNSVKSLSCMHTIEHIGLGRYGDRLDPEGDIKAIKELKRVLAPGGSLIFVTPIGKTKLCYNAHRIYSYKQIIDLFSDLNLIEFSLIPNAGALIRHADPQLADQEDYGCGCFWFKKNV